MGSTVDDLYRAKVTGPALLGWILLDCARPKEAQMLPIASLPVRPCRAIWQFLSNGIWQSSARPFNFD